MPDSDYAPMHIIYLLFGLAYYHSLLPEEKQRILGLPNRWLFALFYAAVAGAEVILNAADLLLWEYPWWHRSFGGIWLIFILRYFCWFAAINAMLGMKCVKKKLAFTEAIYAIPVFVNVLAAMLGWRY